MEDIELKVKKIVAEQLGIKEEDIKNESSFIEALGADSLTTVELSKTPSASKSRTRNRKTSVPSSRPSTTSSLPSTSNFASSELDVNGVLRGARIVGSASAGPTVVLRGRRITPTR